MEYIEGYSGHADQEWLLNFVYSFLKKPKHIFLVHGEPESQEVLKQKIEETTNIEVTIPNYDETYVLGDKIERIIDEKVIKQKDNKHIKLQILERLDILKDEVADMGEMIKEDLKEDRIQDSQIESLSEKIKELERQIVRIIEN